MKKYAQILMMMSSGFLGGLAGVIVLFPQEVVAKITRGQYYDLNLYNRDGKMVGFIGPGDVQQGMMFLFDENGKPRFQVGTYPSGSEKGQALVGLSDRRDQLRFLFRLHGSKDSPTMVMKDSAGRDRIVMGLDGETEAPYIYVTDQYGGARDILK